MVRCELSSGCSRFDCSIWNEVGPIREPIDGSQSSALYWWWVWRCSGAASEIELKTGLDWSIKNFKREMTTAVQQQQQYTRRRWMKKTHEASNCMLHMSKYLFIYWLCTVVRCGEDMDGEVQSTLNGQDYLTEINMHIRDRDRLSCECEGQLAVVEV